MILANREIEISVGVEVGRSQQNRRVSCRVNELRLERAIAVAE